MHNEGAMQNLAPRPACRIVPSEQANLFGWYG